jgi:hypothetical protein
MTFSLTLLATAGNEYRKREIRENGIALEIKNSPHK